MQINGSQCKVLTGICVQTSVCACVRACVCVCVCVMAFLSTDSKISLEALNSSDRTRGKGKSDNLFP